ncbi:threonine synthase [Pyricularia oryzae 70-15]|uniref:Threonine synthase n=3 Tax=Pyricularia oryzae TaxID=318829 RepID=G4NHB3_PYRO7|nr:threonine synthase [Pyricularia oryzae 70-15]EHA47623.1 threonine synthase [Pyricularia oryzae 70-15]ELQ39710.1 threonine synthase [Pyricularia oryzae Y34]
MSSDGGFYLPEGTPKLSLSDLTKWKDLSFRDVALAIFSIFISPVEIPAEHLGQIVDASLAGFPNASFAPVTRVDQHHGLYLAELYHGPGGVHEGFGLKALGAFLDYFLEMENVSLVGQEKHHITVIDGVAGDVGFAASQAFRGRRNISLVSLQPSSETPSTDISENPHTSGTNVHVIGMKASSQDTKQIAWQLARESKPGCVQDLETLLCGSWPRTLAGIASYFFVYFQIARTVPSFKFGLDKVSFGIPTTDWDIIAAFVARRMGLPVERIIVATSQPDGPLDRLWATGRYESDSGAGNNSNNNNALSMTTTRKSGPLATNDEVSPPGQHAVQTEPEFLVSGHVERLFWFLAYDFVTMAGHDIMDAEWDRRQAGGEIQTWLRKLRSKGGFGPVYQDVLESGRRCFGCERTGRPQVQGTVAEVYQGCGGLVVDLGAAAAIKASIKSIKVEKMAGPRSQATVHVVLGLADPALKVEELEETLGGLARTQGVSTCLQKVLNRSRELEERRAAGRIDMHVVAENLDEVKAAVEAITWAALERAG